ncbi:hypothetical protein QP300_10770, partial [Escherichia coli]|nr:hypothetical protein [Escherichia coli]
MIAVKRKFAVILCASLVFFIKTSIATTQVVWGGSSRITITSARYVNGYINVSGQIHLPVNYNMSSWCASGTVGTSFT